MPLGKDIVSIMCFWETDWMRFLWIQKVGYQKSTKRVLKKNLQGGEQVKCTKSAPKPFPRVFMLSYSLNKQILSE